MALTANMHQLSSVGVVRRQLLEHREMVMTFILCSVPLVLREVMAHHAALLPVLLGRG